MPRGLFLWISLRNKSELSTKGNSLKGGSIFLLPHNAQPQRWYAPRMPLTTTHPAFTFPAYLGNGILQGLANMGRFTRFSLATLSWTVVGPSYWLSWRRLAPPLFNVGVLTIPVVAITGMFIGMILALEFFAQFEVLGMTNRMGGVINASVVKQIGPVLAAVMVAGRVGGALAAELGTMRVTEQLDAMRAMSVDPIRNLVVPRFIACVVMTPMLTMYSNALGSWGAWIMVVKVYEVNAADYWYYTGIVVHWWDPVAGLLKSLFFGAAIGWISC